MPNGVDRTDDLWACFRPARVGPITRLTQRLNNRLNAEVLTEDVDLVHRVQTGIRSRDYRFGPLSAREAAVGWFADRVRTSIGEQ